MSPDDRATEGRVRLLDSFVGLSPLDRELALTAHEAEPSLDRVQVLAVALCSRASSCGHTALDLRLDLAEVSARLQPHGGGEDQELWFQALARHWPEVQTLRQASGQLGAGFIILDAQRLYLRRLWLAESRVLNESWERAQSWPDPESNLRAAEWAHRAEPWLDRWLPSTPESSSEDQQRACREALGRRLTLITGGPGTGKTHTAARLIALLQAGVGPNGQALRIGLAAPTGKAAARLQQALQQAWAQIPLADRAQALPPQADQSIARATTLHRLLGAARLLRDPERAEEPPPWLALDVLIVDESSMIDLELMDSLLQALPPQARLILIGDRHQLASVEAGSVLADLVEGLEPTGAVVRLRHSRRFQGGIARLAGAVLEGKPAEFADPSDPVPPPGGKEAESGQRDVCRLMVPRHPLSTQPAQPLLGSQTRPAPRDPLASLVDLSLGPEGMEPLWRVLLHLTPDRWDEVAIGQALELLDRFRVLCGVRRGPLGVEACNQAIEEELRRRGWVRSDHPHYQGQAVMVTRNLTDIGLYNGDLGLVIQSTTGPRMAWLDGRSLRSVSCARLSSWETAFALTVHKSQGSEFDHVALVLPENSGPGLCRELLYTGITRARKRLWLQASSSALIHAASHPLVRLGGLSERLRGLDHRRSSNCSIKANSEG